jgi:hypothetical protein
MWRLRFTALVVVLACSAPLADRVTDTTREPNAPLPTQSQPQLAKYVRGCPATPPNPPVARAVFDVYLGSPRVPNRPSDTVVHAIKRRGARILHRYHVDVIRAAMDTALAHDLVRTPRRASVDGQASR